MSLPTPGACPDGCLLPTGHPWEEVDSDGTVSRNHLYYESPAGYIATVQEETWSPLIGDSVMCDAYVYVTDELEGALTVKGAGVLVMAAASAARACRSAEARWTV